MKLTHRSSDGNSINPIGEPSLTAPEPADYDLADIEDMKKEAMNCNNVEPIHNMCINCDFEECDTRKE